MQLKMKLYQASARWWRRGPPVLAGCPEQTSSEASPAAASKPFSPTQRENCEKSCCSKHLTRFAKAVFHVTASDRTFTASWKLNSTPWRLLAGIAACCSLARSSSRRLVSRALSGERMFSRKQQISSLMWSPLRDDPSPYWQKKATSSPGKKDFFLRPHREGNIILYI